MLRRSWQAALIAAAVVLAANAVRAEDKPSKGSCPKPCACPGVCTFPVYLSQFIGYGLGDECCEQAKGACQDCCKDGKCSADKKCSCKDGCKCEGGCKCCKDGCKCEGGCKCKDCCKGKKAPKTACAGCCCCCASGKSVKKPAMGTIIVVVPMSMMPPMPIHAACPMAPAALVPPMPAPPVPPQTVGVPLPPPPMCYGYPANGPSMPVYVSPPAPMSDNSGMNLDSCLSLLGLVADVFGTSSQPPSLPSMCVSALGLAMDLCGEMSAPPPAPCYVQHPPNYVPPSPPFPEPRPVAVLPPPLPDAVYAPVSSAPCAPPVVSCISAATPATAYVVTTPSATKMRIAAQSDGDQLEMCISGACVSCKKMTVKIGDCPLTVTRMGDKVRIRGEELRASAACIRSERTDWLILEGGAVLRHVKAGQQPDIIRAERIELNPRTGAVTIKAATTIERIGVSVP